jgi:pilus assembly protein CpaC
MAIVLTLAAQAAAQTTPGGAAASESSFERITLIAGRSRVLLTAYEVTRIAVTNPAIADAVVVQPREVLIDAKAPGIISLIIWGESTRVQYDVVVEPGQSTLQQQLDAVFPGQAIRVSVTDEAIVLSGRAATTEMSLRAAEIAQASSSKAKVINMIQHDQLDTQQVMLQVRFAEVSHTAIEKLGVSFAASRSTFNARSTTGQFAGGADPGIPLNGGGGIPAFGDLLNLFFFSKSAGVGGVLKALQQSGQLQTLAEPNLIAYNGQEASFLAGGEFPIPIVNGNTGQVSIQFKEFGVRLSFRPTITGETIRLKVRPEVSTLDNSSGLTLGGYTVPGLRTRRAETDVELGDGQSFAIAGLLNNDAQVNRQAVPWLSRVPIVGTLFKSKDDQTDRTELVVIITPHLVRPLEPAEVPPLPTNPNLFIKPGDELGAQLEGGGGLVDAPAAAGKPRKPGGR